MQAPDSKSAKARDTSRSTGRKLPPWFKVPLPGGEQYRRLKGLMREKKLATVCEEARCPNVGECWQAGTATIMVLGEVCTRGCRFCAVTTGNPRGLLDATEPGHVAEAVQTMGLSYVVLTSVDRDDLPDFGADHYARCIEAIRELTPEVRIEVLTPDFQGSRDSVRRIVRARPDVFAHNIETVARLHRVVRDVRAKYRQSLDVLALAREEGIAFTKSSILLGLGESEAEVLETMADLRTVGCDFLTLGQYLQPSAKHAEVVRFWTPEEFTALGRKGRELGFRHVASAPLVRSSYKAAEGVLAAEREAFSA